MTRSTRWHLDEPAANSSRHLSKEQFGRRLYSLMMARNWNQSELARQADLPRDSISTYIRGVSAPTPKNLKKLAEALDMTPQELYPNAYEMSVDYEQNPAVDMRVSDVDPTKAWLRINRRVSLTTATQIVTLLAEDSSAQTEDNKDSTG